MNNDHFSLLAKLIDLNVEQISEERKQFLITYYMKVLVNFFWI